MSRLGKRTTTIADAKAQLLLVLKKIKNKSRSWKDCFVPPTEDHDCTAMSKFLEIFVKKKGKGGNQQLMSHLCQDRTL